MDREDLLDARVTQGAVSGRGGQTSRDIISVRQLSLRYGRGEGGVLALSDISFSVGDGEFMNPAIRIDVAPTELTQRIRGLLAQDPAIHQAEPSSAWKRPSWQGQYSVFCSWR